jgi:protein-tyrosine phosphatase
VAGGSGLGYSVRMADRIHRFDALDNFRDYGDYATAAGRRLAPGRLFRSAHQARVTDADLERLGGLGIGVIVDLRRPGERRDQPSRRPAGWAGQVIDSDLGADGEAPHMTFLRTQDLTPDSGRRFMTGVYRELPFEPSHLDLFARYFRALGEGDGAVLIHCAAGKDRTGLVIALALEVAGADRDAIIADYARTSERIDQIVLRLASTPTYAQDMQTDDPQHHAARPESMARILQLLEDRHGSPTAWLAEHGFEADAAQQLRARLRAA